MKTAESQAPHQEPEDKNIRAYVAYKLGNMQHLKTRHFVLSIFCCVYMTLLGAALIYAAFGSGWLCLGISILNLLLTIPPLVVRGKTNKLLLSMVSFPFTFCTVVFTLGAYLVISVENMYLFVYWFVVLAAHIVVSQVFIQRRIKSGYYLNPPKRKQVSTGIGYGMAGVLGVSVARILFPLVPQHVLYWIVALVIVWLNSFLLVIAIQMLQVFFLVKKLGIGDQEKSGNPQNGKRTRK